MAKSVRPREANSGAVRLLCNNAFRKLPRRRPRGLLPYALLLVGIVLGGCRSVEPAPLPNQSQEMAKWSRKFRSSGGVLPYFGYSERASEVERNLGL